MGGGDRTKKILPLNKILRLVFPQSKQLVYTMMQFKQMASR